MRGLRDPRQLGRSGYTFYFQLPLLPEATLRAGDFAILRRLLRTDPARADAFTQRDVERYVKALARPGALTAAINYYRAAGRRTLRRGVRGAMESPRGAPARAPRRTTIDLPTLLVWGERDPVLTPRLTHGLERWVPRIEVHRFPNAGHWVHLDEPAAVNALLTEWLRRP